MKAIDSRRGMTLCLPISIAALVALVHSIWGGMLLASESATFVTVHNDTHQWLGGSRHALGALLLVASALSVYAMGWNRRLVFFALQQAILALEAGAALLAIWESAFGDDVIRPRMFIAADQLIIIAIAALHAYEMVTRWPVREILGDPRGKQRA